MTNSLWLTWCGMFLVAVLLPSKMHAQPVTSFGDLERVLQADDSVVVTDAAGQERKGTVLRISPDLLELAGPERLTFRHSEVQEIRQADSLKNGTWIGALVGAAAAGVAIATCDRDFDAEACANGSVGALLLVPIGAGVGALTDALNRPNRLFRAPGAGGTPSMSSSFAGRVKPGDALRVGQRGDRPIDGVLTRVADDYLVMIDDAGLEKRISMDRIEHVSKADSVLNGTLIGLGAGVAAGLTLPRVSCNSGSLLDVACGITIFSLAVPVGTAVGFAVDRMKRRTIYAPGGGSRRRLALSPMISHDVRGIVASISF